MKYRSKKTMDRPRVLAKPITGKETTSELFEKAFGAFVGRELRIAYNIIRRMIEEDHTIILSVSGALTPADFGVSCLIPFMKAGFADVLTTTGANLYHDMQRLESAKWFETDPNASDVKLRKEGLTRIYDIVFPENDLGVTDRLVHKLCLGEDFSRPMTTPEFHNYLGKYLIQYRKRFKNGDLNRSVLVQARQLGIPIFCGAPQDGSIFLNLAYLKRKYFHKYKFSIDMETDIHEFAAYHYLAKRRWSKKLSIIILGGGVPKNYSLQGEPYLGQICKIDVGGYDSDAQICDAHVQNGGLSSCTASEAHTWGKTSEECLKKSQYVFADVTSTFPFIVHALLQDGLKRKPRRLFDCREEAVGLLDKALERRWKGKFGP